MLRLSLSLSLCSSLQTDGAVGAAVGFQKGSDARDGRSGDEPEYLQALGLLLFHFIAAAGSESGDHDSLNLILCSRKRPEEKYLFVCCYVICRWESHDAFTAPIHVSREFLSLFHFISGKDRSGKS